MDRVIKKKTTRSREIADFIDDNVENNGEYNYDGDKKLNDDQNMLEFPIEEDMVNLGVWLQIHHPSFFDSTFRGHLRYLFWLVVSLIITFI